MNERIKDLAIKAYNNAGQGTPDELSLFMQVYSEKFAELIVKECLSIAHQEHKNALEFEWDNDDTAQTIRDSISEHFGVEE